MFLVNIKTNGASMDWFEFHRLDSSCKMICGDGEDMFRINLRVPGTRGPITVRSSREAIRGAMRHRGSR